MNRFSIVLAGFVALGAGLAWADGPQQVAPAPPSKVVYGTDDRIDVYQETEAKKLFWVGSTCVMVSNNAFTQHGNNTFTLDNDPYRPGGRIPCPDEPFGDQPTPGSCTGFMVGPDIIVTAGHCYSSSSLNSYAWVFNFHMLDANTPDLTLSNDNLYYGVEILGRLNNGNYDYCVIRVDRPIVAPGANPFDIRRSGTIPLNTEVGVIGHPAGLPKKLAFSASTQVRENSEDGYFVANLDTYGGNSGSPVINEATGVVEGILVRGETDYVTDTYDPEGEGENIALCGASNVVPNNGGSGEDVSKTTSFMQFVPVATIDTDEDGLENQDELNIHGTDPFNADSDDDSLSDADELNIHGTNPNRADSDFDGVDDGDEINNNTDPNNVVVPHNADTNGDWQFSLREVLRIVQFYNAESYECAEGTEDGYKPFFTKVSETDCFFHNSDYDTADWSISLTELLRLIQYFNLGGYERDVYGEDGFSPVSN